MIYLIIIAALITIASLGIGFFLCYRGNKLKKSVQKLKQEVSTKERETEQRMYELAILKELGERIGYSLNVEKIIDIITGSLRQFIEYSAVSYMLLDPDKIIFKVDLENSVSRKFIDEIQQRMVKSLAALLDKDLSKEKIEETLMGAILVEDVETPVKSFFNIPLVIGEQVVGVLTVAHIKEGLYKAEDMSILYKITQQASNAVTQLQEVVRTEQGKLNAMVESMVEGVVMTDNDYRIMVVNPAAKEVVGLPRTKKDVSIFDFIDNLENRFDIRGKLEESVKLDKILISDDILIKDQFYKIFVSPVKGNENETLGGVVIFHDTTKEKELEKMREDFTSMMVHELRSPLDGIKKMAEAMQKFKEGDQKTYSSFIEMIQSDSGEMLELVNDLLDVAKLEAGKFTIKKINADLKQNINKRVKFFTPAIQEQELNIAVDFNEDFPEEFSFDPKRIDQVLNNLISNAIKYSKPGGQIKIHAMTAEKFIQEHQISTPHELTQNPEQVVVTITDTGVGIAEENISKLFNKFKQFQETSRSGMKGTGLGLVIVKGITQAHGGTVGVFSELGQGSTFYFSLPIN